MKQKLAGILKHLNSSSTSASTYSTYKTTMEQLYSLSGTEFNKPINLSNPHLLFKQLDSFKNPNCDDYQIDKFTGNIQTIFKLILRTCKNKLKCFLVC